LALKSESNDVKVKKSHCCSTRDANFFSSRVVSILKSLASHIFQSPSVATFKKVPVVGKSKGKERQFI